MLLFRDYALVSRDKRPRRSRAVTFQRKIIDCSQSRLTYTLSNSCTVSFVSFFFYRKGWCLDLVGSDALVWTLVLLWSGYRRAGKGVPGILRGVVPPGFSKSYPILDQKTVIFHPRFQTWCVQKLCYHYLDFRSEHQQKDFWIKPISNSPAIWN